MGKKLYVGNLAYDTSGADLQSLFSAHGEVDDARVITDRDTGRSRGFGFVEMRSDEDAQKAIEALNGSDYQGRSLNVSEARERSPRDGGGGRGGPPRHR